MFGLINQPQVWIRQPGENRLNFVNYLLMGIINQPQFRIERKGGNMDSEMTPVVHEDEKVNVRVQGGSGGAVYGLGFIGACVYYISKGETPQEKAVGFLKAIVWPAFLVYEILEYLHED
jgi:hypothetical protein